MHCHAGTPVVTPVVTSADTGHSHGHGATVPSRVLASMQARLLVMVTLLAGYLHLQLPRYLGEVRISGPASDPLNPKFLGRGQQSAALYLGLLLVLILGFENLWPVLPFVCLRAPSCSSSILQAKTQAQRRDGTGPGPCKPGGEESGFRPGSGRSPSSQPWLCSLPSWGRLSQCTRG